MHITFYLDDSRNMITKWEFQGSKRTQVDGDKSIKNTKLPQLQEGDEEST